MLTTPRKINEEIRRERSVYADDNSPNGWFRITWARTIKGELQGRCLNDGRWYKIDCAEVR
jgi:hypothetical protein